MCYIFRWTRKRLTVGLRGSTTVPRTRNVSSSVPCVFPCVVSRFDAHNNTTLIPIKHIRRDVRFMSQVVVETGARWLEARVTKQMLVKSLGPGTLGRCFPYDNCMEIRAPVRSHHQRWSALVRGSYLPRDSASHQCNLEEPGFNLNTPSSRITLLSG